MEPQLRAPEEQRQIGMLLSQILTDLQKLLRQELKLAKTEVRQDWVRGKNAAALFGGAFVALVFATGLCVLALVQGMVAMGIPLIVAYLISAALFVTAGVAAYLLGKRWTQSMSLIPDETLTNIKENVEWLKKRT